VDYLVEHITFHAFQVLAFLPFLSFNNYIEEKRSFCLFSYAFMIVGLSYLFLVDSI
jgi:hypothetical protein